MFSKYFLALVALTATVSNVEAGAGAKKTVCKAFGNAGCAAAGAGCSLIPGAAVGCAVGASGCATAVTSACDEIKKRGLQPREKRQITLASALADKSVRVYRREDSTCADLTDEFGTRCLTPQSVADLGAAINEGCNDSNAGHTKCLDKDWFATCVQGSWIGQIRPCGTGTFCNQITPESVTCGFKEGSVGSLTKGAQADGTIATQTEVSENDGGNQREDSA